MHRLIAIALLAGLAGGCAAMPSQPPGIDNPANPDAAAAPMTVLPSFSDGNAPPAPSHDDMPMGGMHHAQ